MSFLDHFPSMQKHNGRLAYMEHCVQSESALSGDPFYQVIFACVGVHDDNVNDQ